MRRKLLVLGLAVILAAGLLPSNLGGAAKAADGAMLTSLVTTTDGKLQGRIDGGVASFKGVPFAAPPVGHLRWHAPMPVRAWKGIRDALQFGPPCAQAALGWNDAVAARSQEDCLYLNVWAPVRRGRPLPVIVFFPGGASHGGSAQGLSAIEPSYDGGKLAARGVVVVTANYRLGMFGFLAHPELSAESAHHVSGNYALLDDIAALGWVRANIGRFGGDPQKVTILGQSAGAQGVGLLMTSPLAKGFFAGAIAHSGTALSFRAREPDLHEAEAAGAKFAAGLGAPAEGAIAALRRLSAKELIKRMLADPKLHMAEPRGGIVDDYVLPEQPALVFQVGHEAKVPLIVGSMARDGDVDSMGVSGTPKADATLADPKRALSETHKVKPLDAEGLKQVKEFYAAYPDLAAQAVKIYGDSRAIDPADGDAIVAFNTDVGFRCLAGLIAQWHSRIAPTWQFQFSHGYEPLGAVHIWDMFYLFGWLAPPADQRRDTALMDQVQRYWVSFAENADPNAPGLPDWPKSGPQGAYLDFESQGPVAKAGLRAQACALFDQKTERDLGPPMRP